MINYIVLTGTAAGDSLSKVLVMKLTKDDDPLFLRLLEMNEKQFNELNFQIYFTLLSARNCSFDLRIKAQQRLRVNFDEFSSYLISLLDSCLECAKSTNDDAKFLHFIEERDKRGKLEIVASNKSQTWVYLSLNLIHANERQLHTHLCDTIEKFKVSSVEQEVKYKNVISDVKRKLQNVEKRITEQENEFKVKEEKMLSTLKSMKSDVEKEKRYFVNKISKLNEENESIKRQLIEKGDVERENEKLKSQLSESELAVQNLESELRTLELKYDEQVCDYRNLEERLQKVSEKHSQCEEQCLHLEDRLKECEKAYDAQCQETSKGVEIIRKYQLQIFNYEKSLKAANYQNHLYKTKLKEYHLKMSETENLTEKALIDYKKLASEMLLLQSEISTLKEQNAQLNEKLIASRKEFESVEQELKNKETEAKFFKEKLSEECLSRKQLSLQPSTAPQISKHYQPVLGLGSKFCAYKDFFELFLYMQKILPAKKGNTGMHQEDFRLLGKKIR